MSKLTIVVKLNEADNFVLTGHNADTPIIICTDQADADRIVNTQINNYLTQQQLVPDNNTFDLLQFAIAIYTIDQTVSRSNGFQGWSRYMNVHFPVHDVVLWQQWAPELETYLGFLSGDKWEFTFRQNQHPRTAQRILNPNPDGITKVCLFSGGLDSFIAAVNLLSLGEKPAFVSHYKSGGTENDVQSVLCQALGNRYGEGAFKSHRIYLQPKQNHTLAQKENTSRARSFLFISLGITIAHCLGDDIELILPENGLISLNIPLTKTRLSSHSTRTTHPYFVDGLNKVFRGLGIQNVIVNPYGFKTKGEMMRECGDIDFLNRYYGETVSCSHPDHSRYKKLRPGLNCGHCVPCIIRQAAEYAYGECYTEYADADIIANPPSPNKRSGSDLRAFRMGIEGLQPILASPYSLNLQVLRSGPLSFCTPAMFSDYVNVYGRGMQEVANFLNS